MLLDYADVKQELSVFLLELIKNIDVSKFSYNAGNDIYKYICVSLKNKTIDILRKQQKESDVLIELSDDYLIDSSLANLHNHEKNEFELTKSVEFKEALNKLSPKQKEVIICKYILGLSDVEIGQRFNITRMAVNRLKNRAFEILKKYYLE